MRFSCINRRFDFSSERLRSTCVAVHPDGRAVVYVKGSPEKLLGLMDPATVPDKFVHTLQVRLCVCGWVGVGVWGWVLLWVVGVGVDMGAGMGLVQGECELFYVCGRKHVDTAVMFATCCN